MDALLRRRTIMGQGNDAPVFVDWIENTGLEYIDIPVVVNRYYLVSATAILPSGYTGTLLGSRISLLSRELLIGYNGAVYLARIGNKSMDIAQSPSVVTGQKREFRVGCNLAKTEIYSGIYDLEGREVVARGDSLPSEFSGVSPVSIFGLNSSAETKFKVYAIKFIDNSSGFSMDLRPCYFRSEYGLWDIVGGRFYGNSSGQGMITGGYDE